MTRLLWHLVITALPTVLLMKFSRAFFSIVIRRRLGGERHHRGEAYQRGVQDLEEELAFPLRPCRHTRLGVANSNLPVAPRYREVRTKQHTQEQKQ